MEIPAFLSLAGFEANVANDETSVISTTIISMIIAKFIMGETEENFQLNQPFHSVISLRI